MGISEIVAVLAFFVAMVALWLVSDMLKKVESQNEKFISTHIRSLRGEMSDIDYKISSMAKAIKAIEDKSTAEAIQAAGNLAQISEKTEKLEKKLAALDSSIPQRYREKPASPPRSIQ